MYYHYVPRVVPLICPDGEERKEREGGRKGESEFHEAINANTHVYIVYKIIYLCIMYSVYMYNIIYMLCTFFFFFFCFLLVEVVSNACGRVRWRELFLLIYASHTNTNTATCTVYSSTCIHPGAKVRVIVRNCAKLRRYYA